MSGIIGGAGSKSGITGGNRDNNVHPFMAKPSTTQTFSHDTTTLLTFNTTIYNEDGWYDNSTNLHTPKESGVYMYGCQINAYSNTNVNYLYLNKINVLKNNSTLYYTTVDFRNSPVYNQTVQWYGLIEMNGTTDYASMSFYCQSLSSSTVKTEHAGCNFWGFKVRS